MRGRCGSEIDVNDIGYGIENESLVQEKAR